MKNFPFGQLKLLVQARYFLHTNAVFENFKILYRSTNNFNFIKNNLRITPSSFRDEIEFNYSIEYPSKKYSIFSKSNKYLPIKCKIRTNECGEKVAEPYIAEKPSSMTFPPLPVDFTMNPDESCRKLQEKITPYLPPPPECMQSISSKCSKKKFSCPNALTKYLKTKGKCHEVYKSAGTNDCKKKNSCDIVKKYTYTGRDYALEPCKAKANYETKPQSKKEQTKKIFEALISRLKSKKLIKSCGFLNEDLVREACDRLRIRTSSQKLMKCVKNTSNREKSLEIKFGVQNSCKRFFSGVNLSLGFDATEHYKAIEAFLVEKNRLLEFLKNEETGLGSSLGGMSRAVKSKKIEYVSGNDPEGEDKEGINPKNTRKKIQNKSKNKNGIRRRRRRPSWFSRIPIEPNVKGSVIFANATAQKLDDPCKILSVNFSDSSLHSNKEQVDVKHNASPCEPDVQHMMENYDCVMKKLTSKCLINKVERFSKDEESIIDENYKREDSKLEQKIFKGNKDTEETEIFRRRVEPIIRQKKISKLDNTVKCFTTTVSPEKQLQPKKRQKRMRKHSKSDLKQGSTDNLNTTLLNLKNYPSTLSSEAFAIGYHALTTNNLLINFKKGGNHEVIRKNNVEGVKSENSFVNIKEIGPIFESGDEKEVPRSQMNFSKKDILLLPGVTRPVTQKVAYLNLLESKVLTPVSSAWKKNSAHPGGRQKAMGATQNPGIMEIKEVNYQQYRMKSTEKTTPSRCDVKTKPCHNQKKYDGKANDSFPVDWNYEERVPNQVARKWYAWDCSKEKDTGCPITNEDLKKGLPNRKSPSAAAINRCNFEDCKHRLRCRRPVSRCRNSGSNNK